jgi:hypothetical protein
LNWIQERNSKNVTGPTTTTTARTAASATTASTTAAGHLKIGHIPSTSERVLEGIRDLERGKSFAEARTAVQGSILQNSISAENFSDNFHHLGSMLRSQFSAIFANFRKKWRFS